VTTGRRFDGDSGLGSWNPSRRHFFLETSLLNELRLKRRGNMKMTSDNTQNAMTCCESKSLLRAAVEIGMQGMHTVWTTYGKGMGPSLKSFAIKYGGMPYRGWRGWGYQKGKLRGTPAEHFSPRAFFIEH
jgi:hypothetical protein